MTPPIASPELERAAKDGRSRALGFFFEAYQTNEQSELTFMADLPRTHLNWTTETERGKCPICNTDTVLLVAFGEMKVEEEGAEEFYEETGGSVEVDEEITGHYCPKCRRLRSLCLNTL